MRTLILTVVACCLAGIWGCKNSTRDVETQSLNRNAGFVADAKCHSVLSSLDYSDLMPALTELSETLRGAQSAGLSSSSGLKVDPRDPTLTVAERCILHGLHYRSRFGPPSYRQGKAVPTAESEQAQYRKEKYPNTVTMHCSLFFRSEGRLPSDGAELAQFAFRTRTNTSEGLAELMQWSREKQADFLFEFINPVSGKLYGGFSDTVWAPGEIQFRPAGQDDWQRLVETSRRIFSDQTEPLPQSWVVKYCGEAEGRILAEGLNAIIPESSSYYEHPLSPPQAQPAIVDGIPVAGDSSSDNPCNPCNGNPCNPCNPCNH